MAFGATSGRTGRVRDEGGKAERKSPRNGRGMAAQMGWIGLDVTHRRGTISPRRVLPVLIVVLLVALGVASLRIELLRLRYALAAATLEEQRLLDDERMLTAARRRLRDPVHLARSAEGLGFVAPDSQTTLAPAPSYEQAPVLAAIGASASHRPDRP
jgi:hypothetical protein